jgi:polysaccharide biosynthesis transport protein
MSRLSASEPLAAPQFLDIRAYLDIIRRRKAIFIQVFVSMLVVGVVATGLSKPIYQTSAKLLVPAGATSVNIVDSNNPIAAILQATQPDSLATQMQDIQSAQFQNEARERAKIVPAPGVIPPQVRIEALEGTNVLQISVEGGDPQAVVNLANAIVDLHLERTDLNSTTGLKETLDFVRGEKESASRALRLAEEKLLDFEAAHRDPVSPEQREARLRERSDLEGRVREAETNVSTTEAQIGELKARLEKEPAERVVEVQKKNPRVAELQGRVDQLKQQRTALLAQYKPTSRRVQAMDEQIAAAQAEVDAEPPTIKEEGTAPSTRHAFLENRLAELETSLLGHREALNGARARMRAARPLAAARPPRDAEAVRLARDRDSAQEAYSMLSARLRDLEIRKNARLNTARSIEKAATPVAPIRPRKATNIALSALLALCLAVGVTILQEYLDDRVNSPDDVEQISPVPTLGHVPLMSANQPHLVTSLPANSHVAEAYRALRSSIGFAGIDGPLRCLEVTSASKGEGKSVTSVNLATAMAIDGKRVILVDADLRRPNVHRLLNIPNSPGLSEVLVGMKSLDEVIRETEITNLRAVSAGAIPPNPAELLGSSAFDQIVGQLEAQADIVIFDTPPCIPVTDPLIVASRMDGVILVLHVGQTRKAAVKHAIELLERSRSRIVGIVFNRVSPGKSGYYYHHYYYYGDGYYAEAAQRGQRHRRNGKSRLADPQEWSTLSASSQVVKPDDES